MSGAHRSPVRVRAEVLFGRIDDSSFRFHVSRLDLTRRRGDPNVAVWLFSVRRHPELAAPGPGVMHSTSWRHQAGQIVLTYLVFSDDLAFSGAVRRVRLAALPSPETKRKVPSANAVASHALRHLAFLIAEDPSAYSRRVTARSRRHLASLRPDVAGQLRKRRRSRTALHRA